MITGSRNRQKTEGQRPPRAPRESADCTGKGKYRTGELRTEGHAMYGAILGDIIGSPYEFDRGS